MWRQHIDILLPIAVIATISFVVAWGLFALLESTATVSGNWFQLGGGAGGFVVVFWMLRSWYERRDARRADDLAIEIARLSAVSIVKEGGDDVAALNTAYSDNKSQLSDYFSRQDNRWLSLLLKELGPQTKRQVREMYPHLREWQPEEAILDTVLEDF
jgi:Zn-dependent protease with chaperone function